MRRCCSIGGTDRWKRNWKCSWDFSALFSQVRFSYFFFSFSVHIRAHTRIHFFFFISFSSHFSFNNDDEDEHNADDGNGNDIPRNVPNFFAMRRHLQRIRNKVLPSSPCTPLEIQQNFLLPDIMKEYGNAIAIGNDEPIPFYRCVSIEQEFAYCIFASQRIIDEIAKLPEERRHYYMDGTFKVVPFGDFNQLLIIYAEFFQKVKFFVLFRSLSPSESYLSHAFCFSLHHYRIRPYRSFSS